MAEPSPTRSPVTGLDSLVTGLDIGTTRVKASCFDPTGRSVAAAMRTLDLVTSKEVRAEQDPETIWRAVSDCLEEVAARAASLGKVEGIGVGGAMHSLLAVDQRGRPLTNSITWADRRAAEQTLLIREEWGAADIFARTGAPVYPYSPVPKLLWFKQQDPDTWGEAARWVSAKELVIHRLTGEWLVDHSIAAASGLLNLATLQWDEGLLERLGLDAGHLSTPVSPERVVETRDSGPGQGQSVVVGSSDGVLANVGAGALEPEVMVCSVGTSGALRTTVLEPRLDKRGRLFCFPFTRSLWVVGGAVNGGGAVLDWLTGVLWARPASSKQERDARLDSLDELAARSRPGAEDLLFVPDLLGERTSLEPRTGSWRGLRKGHGRADLVRSVFEGIAFRLALVGRDLQGVVGRAEEVRATGGFANSHVWLQILADVFDRRVAVPVGDEGSAAGAALLAAAALGVTSELAWIGPRGGRTRSYAPRSENVKAYRDKLASFEAITAASEVD